MSEVAIWLQIWLPPRRPDFQVLRPVAGGRQAIYLLKITYEAVFTLDADVTHYLFHVEERGLYQFLRPLHFEGSAILRGGHAGLRLEEVSQPRRGKVEALRDFFERNVLAETIRHQGDDNLYPLFHGSNPVRRSAARWLRCVSLRLIWVPAKGGNSLESKIVFCGIRDRL